MKDTDNKETLEVQENPAEETAVENDEVTTDNSVLDADIAAKDQKIEDLTQSLLRLKADYDNYKRRTTEERDQLSQFVTADVVGKVLPVYDSFKRAEAAIEASGNEELTAGIMMIIKQFEQAFVQIGVEKIPTDIKFDPNLHEAMMRGENPDLPEGSIEMVFEEGYKFKDKVIRHTKVKVVS